MVQEKNEMGCGENCQKCAKINLQGNGLFMR